MPEITFNETNVELAANCKLRLRISHRGHPLEAAREAVTQALESPLDFPPLASCTVPEDRIVVAVDRDVPQVADVIAGLIDALLAGEATTDDISVVLTHDNPLGPDDLLGALPDAVQARIRVERHDPDDKSQLCYLAANDDALPIYINRHLYDADVVVPVATLQPAGTLGYAGMHSGLYPSFSDTATQQRFRAAELNNRRSRIAACQQADQAAWLLGVQLSLQLVPGPGNSILHVVAGESGVVAQVGEQLSHAAWQHENEEQASLVVATVEGGPDQQTWQNVARALAAVSPLVDEGGAVVLCTDLHEPPGMSLQRLMADEPLNGDESAGPDALAAFVIGESRERHPVYLLSQLDADTVEDLGIGFVSCLEDVGRLSRNHASCIVVENAHRTSLTGQYAVP